jgi:hypothetical protein
MKCLPQSVGPGAPEHPIQLGLKVKRPERKADHLPPSTAKFKDLHCPTGHHSLALDDNERT